MVVSKILMTTLRSHTIQSFAFKYIPKSPRNEIHFIFQFLQEGTFLWLIHYEKCSISSKILSHKILVHNKRSLEYLGALIMQLLLLLTL